MEFDRRSRDELQGGVVGACGAKRNQPATDGGDVHLTDPWVGFEHGRRGSNFGAGRICSPKGVMGDFASKAGKAEMAIGA